MTEIITETDKLKCAERELPTRKRVYPRLVKQDCMSAGEGGARDRLHGRNSG